MMETKNETQAVTGTDLIVAKGTSLEKIFKSENAFAHLIDKIERKAREDAKKLDPTTKKGRDALVSLAYEVSKEKSALDKEGKALTEKQREEIALVNASRKIAEDRLSALRDEVRKPVTDWEQAEAARKERIEAAMKAFATDRVGPMDTPDDIQSIIDQIEEIDIDDTWGEYEEPAAGARLHAIAKYKRDHAESVKRLADLAELEELRAFRAAQARKEEAAEAERIERERLEAIRLQEEADAKIEAERAEAARIEAEAQAERDRIAAEKAAEEKAEADRLLAIAEKEAAAEREAQHKRDVEAAREKAAQEERDRIQKEADERAAAQAKREADAAHVEQIQSDIHGAVMDLISAVKTNPDAKAGTLATEVAKALMAGKIPHTKVEI